MEEEQRNLWIYKYGNKVRLPWSYDLEEFSRGRINEIVRHRRSVLRKEQKVYKEYLKTNQIPVNYVYLVWRNGKYPMADEEPKTLNMIQAVP